MQYGDREYIEAVGVLTQTFGHHFEPGPQAYMRIDGPGGPVLTLCEAELAVRVLRANVDKWKSDRVPDKELATGDDLPANFGGTG